MAAKKKIDTTCTDPEYWESILSDEGLGMDEGMPPRKMIRGKRFRKTFGAGTAIDLGRVAEENYGKKSGKVNPSGYGPE
jgi:hypothetical protein